MTNRLAVALLSTIVTGGSFVGCACPCTSPSPYAATGTVYSAPARDVSARPAREHAYYDRSLEERHRREVEKDLRDIKRNTRNAR